MTEDVNMSFGEAIEAMKADERVTRLAWKNAWIAVEPAEPDAWMTQPYIYICYTEGHDTYPEGARVPWTPSPADILAEDWALYLLP